MGEKMDEANSMPHHQALHQQHNQKPQQHQQQQHLQHHQLFQQQFFLMQQKQQQQLQQHQQQQHLQQHQQQQHLQQQQQQHLQQQQQQQLQQHQQQQQLQQHQQQQQLQQHQQQQQMQQHQQQQQLQQQQQQQQQLQQLQQQQQQQLHQPQQRQPFNLQQQAISRFPSNIDAHLRAPGLRTPHFYNPPPPSSSSTSPLPSPAQSLHRQPPPQVSSPAQQQQLQPRAAGVGIGVGVGRGVVPAEVEMAQQDAFKVCNPDVKRPFDSIEDAVHRLLPYHVVSDYEAEEDDRILDSDTTGRIHSRLQQWDQNILTKIDDFTTTFEKQVLAFNILTRKRSAGEFRSEERLMIEQALLQEEKYAILQVKAYIESREKVGREAVEAKMRMAMVQAEQARAEAQSYPEMIIRPAVRASAASSQGDAVSGHDLGQEQGSNMEEIQGWANAQRDDDEASEDFLNDENEPENGEAGTQDKWRGTAALDLNSR